MQRKRSGREGRLRCLNCLERIEIPEGASCASCPNCGQQWRISWHHKGMPKIRGPVWEKTKL